MEDLRPTETTVHAESVVRFTQVLVEGADLPFGDALSALSESERATVLDCGVEIDLTPLIKPVDSTEPIYYDNHDVTTAEPSRCPSGLAPSAWDSEFQQHYQPLDVFQASAYSYADPAFLPNPGFLLDPMYSNPMGQFPVTETVGSANPMHFCVMPTERNVPQEEVVASAEEEDSSGVESSSTCRSKRRHLREEQPSKRRCTAPAAAPLEQLIQEAPSLVVSILTHPSNFEAIRQRALQALAQRSEPPPRNLNAVFSHMSRYDWNRASPTAEHKASTSLLRSHSASTRFNLLLGDALSLSVAAELLSYHWDNGVLARIVAFTVPAGVLKIQKLFRLFSLGLAQRNQQHQRLVPGCPICGALRYTSSPQHGRVELRCLLCEAVSRGRTVWDAIMDALRTALPAGPPVTIYPSAKQHPNFVTAAIPGRSRHWPLWIAITATMGPCTDWFLVQYNDRAKCRHCGFGLVAPDPHICCFCGGSDGDAPEPPKPDLKKKLSQRLTSQVRG
eukprot:Protomagalhaensia_wolfi_Nauph_80__3839@NODE_388_length_2626_cov_8_710089_g293_i0_p1_GENE_NODE_388_length_2626_cov_8_710089_g293_i0NODE_388_length_2626_cov_8_710089_g293_i0_p1_ORF_typecomplete_len504_score89_76FdhE/PF04216_12/0_013FdhE/PF04216_12/1_3e04_NODE_388_length_2626_cov_8_710089_g293_i011512